MKRLVFLLLTIVSVTNTKAQEQTFTHAFDSIFQYVNRADATTGILYNRTLPFSGLYKFSVPDTANSNVFMQAYSELYNAAFINTSKITV